MTVPALFKRSSEHSCDIDSQSLAAILPAALPDKRDYCNDVRMATVRSASALLLHLLNNVKQSCSLESVTESLSLLRHTSLILLSSCPVSCYDLMVTYLQSSAAAETSLLTLTNSEFDESRRFCSLIPEIVTQSIRAVARHPNFLKLEEVMKCLQPMSGQ